MVDISVVILIIQRIAFIRHFMKLIKPLSAMQDIQICVVVRLSH